MLVGLGQIGMGYDFGLDASKVFTHARAFAQHPAFSLQCAVDPDPALRAAFTNAYGCPAYADLASACASHAPQLVAVAAPTALHGDIVRTLLAQPSVKAILCEKPLSYSIGEAREMVAQCAAQGVQLYVNYMRRADAGIAEVARRIASGALGTPLKGVCWYSKGFLHNGSHWFNLLQYWLGELRSATVLAPGRLWDGKDPEPDLQLQFERGSITMLSAWEEAFSHFSIELLSPAGRLRYEQGGEQGGEQLLWQATVPDAMLPDYTVLAPACEAIPMGMARSQWHVADQLALALAGQPALLCSGQDALRTLENMHHILELREAS